MNGVDRRLLSQHAFSSGLPDDVIDALSEHAQLRTFAAGELLFGEGDRAEWTYLVTAGRVALEVHVPHRHSVVIETIESGNVVGLSWAAPPHRFQFDARAVDAVEAIALDTAQLRSLLVADAEVASVVFERLVAVVLSRLQATRVRLLDLYGPPDAL